MNATRSDALVFFGATGDLAGKQIFSALQALVRRKRLEGPVVAVGRKPLGIDELKALVKKSLAEHGGVHAAAFETLSSKLRYVAIDFDDPATFSRIREALGGARHPLHYVALPPDVFEKVAVGLAKAGLTEGARLVLEKPFCHDAASAKALSAALHPHFPEASIFRIDHFLGKEAVENILYFRAANSLFEAALRREHVESVQITMAETFGVEGRAKFYDSVGAIRDVVQNHLLEIVACLTLDLPGRAWPRWVARGPNTSVVCDKDTLARRGRPGAGEGLRGGEGRQAGLDDRDVRRGPSLARQRTVGRRPFLPPRGKVPRGNGDGGDRHLQAKRQARPRRDLSVVAHAEHDEKEEFQALETTMDDTALANMQAAVVAVEERLRKAKERTSTY